MTIQEHESSEQNQLTTDDIVEPMKSVDTSRRSFAKSGLVASGVLLTLGSRPVLGGSYSYGGGGGGEKVCKTPSGFMSGNLSHHGKQTGGGGHSCDYWKSHCSSSDWQKCDRSKSFCEEFGFSHNYNSKYGCKITYYKYDSQHHTYSNCGGSGGSNYSNKYDRDDSSSLYVPYTCLDILSRCHAGHAATGTKSDCDVTLQKDSYGRITSVKNNCYTSYSCPDLSICRTIDTVDDWDRLAQHCMKALLNCRAGLTPFCTEQTVKAIYNECRTKTYFEPTAGVKWTPKQCVDYLISTENCTDYS
jgi:hypothetical protein